MKNELNHARMPSSWQVVRAVSEVTRSEILKDRVLYNVLLVALLMLGVTFLASQLSFIHPYRVVLDFGSSAVMLACVMVSLFLGASLVIKEFDRRTILVALSHPISRFQFLIGKYVGLAQVLFLNWLALVLVMAALYYGSSHDSEFAPLIQSPVVIWAFVFIWIESLIVAAIAVLFSTFSTISVSVMLTLGVLVLGHNISELSFLAVKTESSVLKLVIRGFTKILPNFELYSLKSQLTYGLPLPSAVIVSTLLYSLVYLGMVLVAAGVLIRGRDR